MFGKCQFLLRWKKVLSGSCALHYLLFYPEQVCYSYDDIHLSSVYSGVQFEGDLGEIVALGAKILPYIGLEEKWESP